MNNHLQTRSKPRSLRCGFAAGAVVMTLAIAAIIDGLATHYTVEGLQLAQQPVVMARR